MKTSRINYVMVGGFVLAMLAVLIVALSLMTGRVGGTRTYYTYYDNVGGVKYGTKVTVEGFPVGQVAEIIPEVESPGTAPRFKLRLEVAEDWVLASDSLARIAASGLLAAVAIDIKAGESGKPIPEDGVIPSQQRANMFAALNEVASEITDLSQSSIRPLLQNLNNYVEALGGSLVGDAPTIVADLKTAAAALAEKVPEISQSVASFSRNLDQDVLGQGNRDSLRSTIENTRVAAETFAALARDLRDLKGEVATTVATLERMIGKADQTMTGVAEMVDGNQVAVTDTIEEMRYTMKAISRRIDTITYNLDGTARNMFEFSRSIRQNPGLLLGGSPPADEASQ
ncbi:MlaD family protein [Roseospirillum parvum]|uniref:Phospholipid/cholesterol/gamma-HCH transport system substrate-binding protein n=1 Tax=Roseospirillum parvum TaxID=83401 RepID=A0A1G8CIK0_9PROT|nr:MlaD family protein [Roseospirillum parvum]SDH45219.1 phospholipid/cholesterol/gamma-HCH transport system substrate-binding protein [Roseospirillum parvum]